MTGRYRSDNAGNCNAGTSTAIVYVSPNPMPRMRPHRIRPALRSVTATRPDRTGLRSRRGQSLRNAGLNSFHHRMDPRHDHARLEYGHHGIKPFDLSRVFPDSELGHGHAAHHYVRGGRLRRQSSPFLMATAPPASQSCATTRLVQAPTESSCYSRRANSNYPVVGSAGPSDLSVTGLISQQPAELYLYGTGRRDGGGVRTGLQHGHLQLYPGGGSHLCRLWDLHRHRWQRHRQRRKRYFHR